MNNSQLGVEVSGVQ